MRLGGGSATLVAEVGLDAHGDFALPLQPSASEGSIDGVHRICTHGCTTRVRFPGSPRERVIAAWESLGFPVYDPDSWCVVRRADGVERYRMLGSASLTGRAPGRSTKTRNSALVKLRREHRMALYCLDLELTGPVGPTLGIQTVRQSDVAEIIGLLGLQAEICHYSRIERYVVLAPTEAHKLASAFDKPLHHGRGRNSPKQFAIESVPIRVTLPDQRSREVTLKAYRITRGATASFRLEATLGGQKAKGNVYRADAFEAVDEVLLNFLHRYGLRTIPKPARWEPLEPSRVRAMPSDRLLTGVRSSGWRGRALTPAARNTVARLHTPHGAFTGRDIAGLPEIPSSQDALTASACISVDRPPEGDDDPASFTREVGVETGEIPTLIKEPETIESTYDSDEVVSFTDEEITIVEQNEEDVEGSEIVERASPKNCPLDGVLREIQTFGQGLHEIVLDFEDDPKRLIDAIKKRFGDSVGFGSLSLIDGATGWPDTWNSVVEALSDRSIRDEQQVSVIVVDPNVVSYWHEAFCDIGLRPGPFVAKGWSGRPVSGDISDRYWDVLGTALYDDLERLREATERPGGGIVIFVTVDARPLHAVGAWRKSHGYTDARVRSILGRAGARFCHQRYFVESALVPVRKVAAGVIRKSEERIVRRVICWKDEIEGLVGRCAYVDGSVELEMPLGCSQHARVTLRRSHFLDNRPWFPTKQRKGSYDIDQRNTSGIEVVGLG